MIVAHGCSLGVSVMGSSYEVPQLGFRTHSPKPTWIKCLITVDINVLTVKGREWVGFSPQEGNDVR